MNRQKFYTGYGLLSVVLMVLLMFSSLPAMAEKYELYIAGTQVTDANCNALKDITGVTVAPDGEFKYDPAERTLTMKGVTVSVGNDGKNAIWNKDIEGLTIEVSGTNRLESNIVVLYAAASIEIKGRGSLTVINKSNANIGIYLASSNTTVTISDISLEVSGKWGISGEPSKTDQALILKNARITASGTEAAIEDFTSFTSEGCEIVEPAGGKFDKTKHAVVDAEENKAKEVKIVPKYNLYIAGTQVTGANCNNLKDIKGVTVAEGGEFKYDPAEKTLTMKGVTVSTDNSTAMWNGDIAGLKIEVLGSNRLEAKDGGLTCLASTEIEGDGSLTIASEQAAVFVNGTTLTIFDITLEATGEWGIAGDDGNHNETLIIKNATVTAKGKEAAIAYLKTFTLEGCQIIAPEGAEWKDEKNAVVDKEGNKAKEVKIEPTAAKGYELYIAGKQVTDANCDDLSGIKGVTVAEGGEFKYDPAKNMLMMKDVTVSAGYGKNAIWNKGIGGLEIVISGSNRLEATNWSALNCYPATEIEGNGSLTTTSNSGSGVNIDNTTLTISNITLEATGKRGIAGRDGNQDETLIIKNATVTAKGEEAAIAYLKTFTLEGCQIIAPAGAEWKDEKNAVVDKEGNKAKEVKIGKAAIVAVTGVKVTPTTVDLKVNETQQLTVTVEPNNATNKNYTCESDNEGVATVDNTGLVTAVGAGTATITITTEDGGKTITCSVNVTGGSSPSFALSFNESSIAAAGATLNVDVTSDKAWTLDYDGSVTWLKASTKTGAGSQAVTFTVEKNEASAPRTVVVTFKQAETEKVLQLTITQEAAKPVHVPLQGISFEEANMKLKVEMETTLVVKYNPENATNKKVTWVVTEGAASLSVDENGKITATNVAGIAKVRAKTAVIRLSAR